MDSTYPSRASSDTPTFLYCHSWGQLHCFNLNWRGNILFLYELVLNGLPVELSAYLFYHNGIKWFQIVGLTIKWKLLAKKAKQSNYINYISPKRQSRGIILINYIYIYGHHSGENLNVKVCLDINNKAYMSKSETNSLQYPTVTVYKERSNHSFRFNFGCVTYQMKIDTRAQRFLSQPKYLCVLQALHNKHSRVYVQCFLHSLKRTSLIKFKKNYQRRGQFCLGFRCLHVLYFWNGQSKVKILKSSDVKLMNIQYQTWFQSRLLWLIKTYLMIHLIPWSLASSSSNTAV